MVLHMHQGSCRQELWSAKDVQSRAFIPRKSSRMPNLLLIPVCDMNTEHTHTTCAATMRIYSTCTGSHGKHTHSACATLYGAHCCSISECNTFSAACRLVGMRSSLRKDFTCSSSNSLSELGTAATMEWKPALDNILLAVSIALAYVAGIVTPSSPAPSALTSSALWDISQEVPNVLQAANAGVDVGEEDLWSGARSKLLKCLDGDDDVKEKTSGQGVQLSLQALARGPRLRLLLITLEQLKKEVCNFQENESFLQSDWSKTTAQTLCGMVTPICRSWMCKEHLQSMKSQFSSNEECLFVVSDSPIMKSCLSKKSDEMVDNDFTTQWNSLFDSYSPNYDGSKPTMDSLQATGKAEFYSDFLYFMCCGRVRFDGVLNLKTFKNYESLFLDDLLIFLADKASALYLDLISAGNPVCDSQGMNILAHTVSSTRLLEKFRNEVALNGWLNENFRSVVAMFEDRFDLWILKCKSKTLREDGNAKAKKQSNDWVRNSKERECPGLVIGQYKLPARRVRELRALTGWRYYFSLYLEFSDICGPILKNVVTKLGEGISFLLVILIGRSLGLIYRGIRQSVQWNSS